MKPKRPTETDLLAVVQNGFQDQLARDQDVQENQGKPCPPPIQEAPAPLAPAALVRITLAIPEDLRYRIKLAVIDLRRKAHPRLTQDAFCAEALQSHLERRERDARAGEVLGKARAFLETCVQTKGLKRPLAAEAATLIGMIDQASTLEQPQVRPGPRQANL